MHTEQQVVTKTPLKPLVIFKQNKSPSDKIMRDVFDEKGIDVQAKGSICESSSDMLPK